MKNNFPSKNELKESVVRVLSNGKVLKASEINDLVIIDLNLSKEIVELEDESGIGTKLQYRMRWVRTELKSDNILDNPKKGYWVLKKVK